MNRRELLAGVPAACVIPAAATALPEEDPILPLYREWLAASAEAHRLAYLPGNEDLDLPEYSAAEEREEAAFKAIVGIGAATSMAGIAALAHVLLMQGGLLFLPTEPGFEEAVESCPEFRLHLAIWRSASGEAGFPPSPEGEVA